jgi:D-xylose 1-dehydrogenase (NADP+, D-xylono-1,5-lactone-forming)
MENNSIIRFGVLGTSRIAQKNALPAIQSSQLAELVMVGSRDPERGREISEKFGGSKWGSYEDVLNDPEIDAVYISLPNSMHEEWSIKVAHAGKHVWCEKPAATSCEGAKKMVRATKENNTRLMEGFMFRYHPQHEKIKALIKEGVLGELRRFEGCFGYPTPDKESTAMSKELEGGSLHATGCYPIAASRMIFQEEPERVFAKFKIDPISGVDFEAHIMLQFPNNKTALVSSLFGSYYQSSYTVLGTEARVRAARAYAVPKDMETKLYLDKDDIVEETVVPPADHFELMLDDFCTEIGRGSESTKEFEEELLNQARVMEAAKRSAKENSPITVSKIK